MSGETDDFVLTKQEWDEHAEELEGVSKKIDTIELAVIEIAKNGMHIKSIAEDINEIKRDFVNALTGKNQVPLLVVLLIVGILGTIIIFDRAAKTDRDIVVNDKGLHIMKHENLKIEPVIKDTPTP